MLQVTPLLELSLFTCAVIVIWLPASAVAADADTETVMFGGIEVPPPPHATIMAARANAGDSTARRVARAIMPPVTQWSPISGHTRFLTPKPDFPLTRTGPEPWVMYPT